MSNYRKVLAACIVLVGAVSINGCARNFKPTPFVLKDRPPAKEQRPLTKIEAIEKKARNHFDAPPGTRFEETMVPNIYVFRVPGFDGCPPYVDGDVTMIANLNTRGWKTVRDGENISPDQQQELGRKIYNSIPKGAIFPVGKKGGNEKVLISGVDCEPSAMMEARLSKQGGGYMILPSAINNANRALI